MLGLSYIYIYIVYILWGFILLCIEAQCSMTRGWRDGAFPRGAVADGNDTTRALMITILPVHIYIYIYICVSGAAGDNLGAASLLCVVYVEGSLIERH